MKDKSNYISIVCLPLVWNLLTGMLSKSIYGHLDKQNLLPEEQDTCREKARGRHDLLYIDKTVLNEVKPGKKNLTITCIDYRKACDMIPPLQISKCLSIFNIGDDIKKLISFNMKWKVDLYPGDTLFESPNINNGIFQGVVTRCTL